MDCSNSYTKHLPDDNVCDLRMPMLNGFANRSSVISISDWNSPYAYSPLSHFICIRIQHSIQWFRISVSNLVWAESAISGRYRLGMKLSCEQCIWIQFYWKIFFENFPQMKVAFMNEIWRFREVPDFQWKTFCKIAIRNVSIGIFPILWSIWCCYRIEKSASMRTVKMAYPPESVNLRDISCRSMPNIRKTERAERPSWLLKL